MSGREVQINWYCPDLTLWIFAPWRFCLKIGLSCEMFEQGAKPQGKTSLET